LDHFHQIKQSGNICGVVGWQLLKWNLMSSEWNCLLNRRRFSFWHLPDFQGPPKVGRPRGRARKSRRYQKENLPHVQIWLNFFPSRRFFWILF
jgi:hypothetical protein